MLRSRGSRDHACVAAMLPAALSHALRAADALLLQLRTFTEQACRRPQSGGSYRTQGTICQDTDPGDPPQHPRVEPGTCRCSEHCSAKPLVITSSVQQEFIQSVSSLGSMLTLQAEGSNARPGFLWSWEWNPGPFECWAGTPLVNHPRA